MRADEYDSGLARLMARRARAARRRFYLGLTALIAGVVAIVVLLVVASKARSPGRIQEQVEGDRAANQTRSGRRADQSSLGNERGLPLTECRVGETASFGDISVRVASAQVSSFTSRSFAGRRMEHEQCLLLKLQIRNWNPNKAVVIYPQSRHAVYVDDVGNRVDAAQPRDDLGQFSFSDEFITPRYEPTLRSDDPARSDTVVFPRPVPGASKITVTLFGDCYGEPEKKLLVHLSRRDWGEQ
jgi:hypothetical protein